MHFSRIVDGVPADAVERFEGDHTVSVGQHVPRTSGLRGPAVARVQPRHSYRLKHPDRVAVDKAGSPLRRCALDVDLTAFDVQRHGLEETPQDPFLVALRVALPPTTATVKGQ